MSGDNLSPSVPTEQLDSPLDLFQCGVESNFAASDSTLRHAITAVNPSAIVACLQNKELILKALQIKETVQSETPIQPAEAMQYVLQSPLQTISKDDAENPPKFGTTLLAAHQFDSALPPVPDAADENYLLLTALTWKVTLQQRLQTKNAARLVPDDHPPDPTSGSPTVSIPGRTGMEGGSPGDESSAKKQRISFVGGIQIVDEKGKDTTNRPLKLGPYPGKTHAISSLSVTNLMGSKILRSLLQKGTNLETAVASMRWCRGVNGDLMAAESEAYSLARMIHIANLSYDTMDKALEESPWMEIGLTRLYALIHVENAILTKSATRAAAWRAASQFLESNPGTPGLLAEYENSVAKQFALEVKASNAFKSMQKTCQYGRYPRQDRLPQQRDRSPQRRDNRN
ncbi:hypothetical protein FGB62_253g04 [Gracilaria domingensis]|nr:hypothetical protein FGB62_253g04 [Gracilaria domingensis]